MTATAISRIVSRRRIVTVRADSVVMVGRSVMVAVEMS